MARVTQTNKPLSVNPLRVSQPMGAALAFLGLNRAIPLEHGAQGCTAFSKVFFTRHFREPIPFQTTAMDMVSTVMGSDERLWEAFATLTENHQPEIIGLITTGLAEMQGSDVQRVLRNFHREYGKQAPKIVAVNTPDTLGGLETGFALAVYALIDALIPDRPALPEAYRARQVNILASAMLTPADLEALRDWVERFDLQAVILPDLSDSLDGHLAAEGYSNLTTGGLSQAKLASMNTSLLTLVIGDSLNAAADLLHQRTGIPDVRFSGLSSISECDAFIQALADAAKRPVPATIIRQREQLMDALVDSYAALGGIRIAIGADGDQLIAFSHFLADTGALLVAAVTPCPTPQLALLPLEEVLVGDFEDLEDQARAAAAQILIGNSHALQSADRLKIPLIRAGFPQYDYYGASARQWVGYQGMRQLVFELANLRCAQDGGIPPYHSVLRQDFTQQPAAHLLDQPVRSLLS